eukprot:6458102-Amphidinium_carterae.1
MICARHCKVSGLRQDEGSVLYDEVVVRLFRFCLAVSHSFGPTFYSVEPLHFFTETHEADVRKQMKKLCHNLRESASKDNAADGDISSGSCIGVSQSKPTAKTSKLRTCPVAPYSNTVESWQARGIVIMRCWPTENSKLMAFSLEHQS